MSKDEEKYSDHALWKLRNDMQMRTDLSELQKKRYAGSMELLKRMPGVKIRDQILYIEKNLLPAVAKRGGKDSPDYKLFEAVIDSLKWSLVLYDRMDALMRKDALVHLEKTILEERVLLYEKELLKYTTMEDLYLTDALDHIERGVRERIKAAVEAKKG